MTACEHLTIMALGGNCRRCRIMYNESRGREVMVKIARRVCGATRFNGRPHIVPRGAGEVGTAIIKTKYRLRCNHEI